MSMMKASEKLRSIAGANITESMSRHQGGAGGSPNLQAARPVDQDRFTGLNRVKGAFQIPPDRITPDPNQPRKEFDPEGLERLARSLKERGQLQPLRVRWDAEMGKWVIVVGERRWRAAIQAGLSLVSAVEVTGPLTEDEILEEQLIENCLREDLKPIEQAKAYKALMASQGLSQVQLAERLHVGQGTIAKALALLNLPEPIQVSVELGAIAPNTAYELTKVEDPAKQAELAREAAAGRLKRDEIQERARTTRKSRGGAKAKKLTSRVFRSPMAKVTVELRKGEGGEAILTALEEAARQLRDEMGTGDQAAA
jgi:ParB family transcriptional regulator, chromosome partitioning protein